MRGAQENIVSFTGDIYKYRPLNIPQDDEMNNKAQRFQIESYWEIHNTNCNTEMKLRKV